MSLRIISLLVVFISCEGREYINRISPITISDLANGNAPRRARNGVYYIKLSPVPSDVEVPGSQSPSVGGIGTQFEVLLAPSAPSNNFILQPVQQGSYHQPFSSSGTYYIDHQGNLAQRPEATKPLNFQEAPPVFPHLTDEELTILGQPLSSHHTQDSNQPNNSLGFLGDVNGTQDQRPRPGTSPVPGVASSPAQSVGISFAQYSYGNNPYLMSPSPTIPPMKPSAASQTQNQQQSTSYLQSTSLQNNPATTQHHQYAPQQPTYSQQYPQSSSNYPQTGEVKPAQTVGLQQQTSSQVQAYQSAAPANPSSTLTGPPSLIYKPGPPPTNIVQPQPQPSPIKPPGGVYIATVNYGPVQPSAVFTCLQTHLLDQAVLESGQYSPGPRGYSCKASRGRPLLSNHLLSTNIQSPVAQPTLSKETTSLPIVIPIKFL